MSIRLMKGNDTLEPDPFVSHSSNRPYVQYRIWLSKTNPVIPAADDLDDCTFWRCWCRPGITKFISWRVGGLNTILYYRPSLWFVSGRVLLVYKDPFPVWIWWDSYLNHCG